MRNCIEIKGVSKTFNKVSVLNNINLNIKIGEQAVLMGRSGSGKSTLMYIIGGLESADNGSIIYGNDDILKFSDAKMSEFRNRSIGFVFQFHYLLSSLNCIENILLPARIGGHKIGEVKKRVLNYAEDLDVANLLKKFPHELSGGEQQRMNILRAISLRPKLILCDEPTGNLDSNNSNKVIDLLKRLASESNSSLLVVTHDNEVSDSFSNHYNIVDGRIS